MQVSFKSAHPQPPRNCVPEISDSIPTYKKNNAHTGDSEKKEKFPRPSIMSFPEHAGEEFFGAGRPTVPHISREKKMGGGDIGKTSGRGD